MGGIIEAITTLNGDTLPAPDSYKTLNNLNSVHKRGPKLKIKVFLKQELFQVNSIEHTGSHDCGNHLSKWNSIEVGRNRNGECLIRAIHHPEKCLEAAKKVGWGFGHFENFLGASVHHLFGSVVKRKSEEGLFKKRRQWQWIFYPKLSWRHSKVVPKLSQSCANLVSKWFKSCRNFVPKLSQSSSKVVSKLSQNWIKVVLKLSQNCPEVVPKLSKSILIVSTKLSSNCSKIVNQAPKCCPCSSYVVLSGIQVIPSGVQKFSIYVT